MTDTQNRIADLIRPMLRLDRTAYVAPTAKLHRDLMMDSLDRQSLACELDQAFGIEVPDDDVTSWCRIADFDHPTVKPGPVMDKIVRNVAGSTICDPFMGTGSTGVAAIKAGRRFVGIEKNPRHFETAVTRLTLAWEEAQRQAA